MDFRYAFVYAAVDMFSILMSIVILSRLSYNMGSERQVRVFQLMSLCFFGFVVCDLLWVLAWGNLAPVPPFVGTVAKIISTLLIPLMVYFWFLFAEMRFGTRSAERPLFRALWFIPMAVLIVLYIFSIWSGVVFSFGPNHELVPGPAIAMTGLVDNIYGIAIVVHAIILAVRDKATYRRREYFAQVMFIVICTAGGMINAAVSDTPIMPLAIALSFTYLMTSMQEGQIYNDTLTGLNNRRRADRFLEDTIGTVGAQGPFYLFMLDIDNFKHINDTYGHLEGDKALKASAQAIAKTTGNLGGFAARWGGDEFVVVVRGSEADVPQRFEEELKANLAEAVEEQGLGYGLSASIGYTKCTSGESRPADLLSEADSMLYKNKAATKRLAA
ncbi:MAG: GGDEF domain-containing protein [Eggerthellaceae bacterium]|nr:GGDEF domain-containing protein [Eggerthellaceae bacterium]